MPRFSAWKASRKELDEVYRVFDEKNYNAYHPTATAWRVYRCRAKRDNLDWGLSRVHLVDLVTDNCFYCTASPNPLNGIDRVDNSCGYVEDNVVTCCLRCNKAKNSSPVNEFTEWGKRLGDNLRRWSGSNNCKD